MTYDQVMDYVDSVATSYQEEGNMLYVEVYDILYTCRFWNGVLIEVF